MTREIRPGEKTANDGHPAKVLPQTILWVLLASLSIMAFALAPAIDIFVLNHEQKQCAMFWPGDEYVYYAPPKPWVEAKPGPDGMIRTESGSCNLNEQSYEECCKNLGYTYIGRIKGVVEKRDYGLSIILLIEVLFFLILRYWWFVAILLIVVYLVRNHFKQNANKPKSLENKNDS